MQIVPIDAVTRKGLIAVYNKYSSTKVKQFETKTVAVTRTSTFVEAQYPGIPAGFIPVDEVPYAWQDDAVIQEWVANPVEEIQPEPEPLEAIGAVGDPLAEGIELNIQAVAEASGVSAEMLTAEISQAIEVPEPVETVIAFGPAECPVEGLPPILDVVEVPADPPAVEPDPVPVETKVARQPALTKSLGVAAAWIMYNKTRSENAT